MIRQISDLDEFFGDINKKLGTKDGLLAGTTATYVFKLSGPGGGDFHVISDDGVGSAGRGDLDDPDLTFTASAADFLAVVRGEVDGVLAFMDGRLQMRGDQALSLPLAPVFLDHVKWDLQQLSEQR